ncbi:MAG: type IVB secretion system protein IcmH/DotU [Candidatus Desantisbacteria bacterium]
MTLYELSSQLFLFLVSFRRKVHREISMSITDIQKELDRIFEAQGAIARQDIRLENLYKRVKYLLVVLADEIIINSSWEHADIWENELLERKFFKTSIAGTEFFEQLEKLLNSNPSTKDEFDVLQIFYICLCLGFKGKYSEDADELRNLRSRIYRHLPEALSAEETKLTPDAYYITPTTGKRLQPLVNLTRVAIVCVGFCVMYIIVNQFLWYDTINAVHKVVEEIVGVRR